MQWTRSWCPCIAILLATMVCCASAREVTNEDIRDAMLSLVHMVRAGEDKLERHEYRERQLGQQLQKALAGLEKRHRALEPVKGALGRLDERLASVETILLQKDERERIQLQKTNNALESLRSDMQTWVQTMELVVRESVSKEPSRPDPAVEQQLKQQKELDNTLKAIKEKVDELAQVQKALAGKMEGALEALPRFTEEVKRETSKHAENQKKDNESDKKEAKQRLEEVIRGQTAIADKLQETSKLVQKHLDKQLEKAQEKTTQLVQSLTNDTAAAFARVELQLKDEKHATDKHALKLTDIERQMTEIDVHINELKNFDPEPKSDWHPAFLAELAEQMKKLQEITTDEKKVMRQLKLLGEEAEAGRMRHNETLEAVEKMRDELATATRVAFEPLEKRLEQLAADTRDGFTGVIAEHAMVAEKRDTVERLEKELICADVGKSYEQLRAELNALGKMERVMIQTADNVMDTKRRIEYGVHQILLEVGDLVKIHSKDVNNTLHEKLTWLETSVLDKQQMALANFSTKLEQEISQVWRQIGIMYQQLTASTVALDRLQEQTETYVNGSLSTMDSMEGKVGQITGRMAEVDENLNYLLGRLSLVTQEFNQIKTGLGAALDNIRSSFRTVQERLGVDPAAASTQPPGPGPHQIPSAENTSTLDQ